MVEDPVSQFVVSSLSEMAAFFAWSLMPKSVDTLDNEGASTEALASDAGAEVERSSSNLVDPASSHMLVSKVKPCMS